MINIYKDKTNGAFLIQSTCLDPDSFLADFSEALAEVHLDAEQYLALFEVAMPIAFKLSGYKADQVREERTLVCGNLAPSDQSLVVSTGK